MTVYVYAWPPTLGLKDQRWSVIDPVQTSRSPLTGKDYTTAHALRRRVVDLEVSTRADHGYGTLEGLIALLKGGVNCVRLRWYGPTTVTGIRGAALSWDSEWDVTWEGAITGSPQAGTPPKIALTGLTPSKRVARAGEYIGHGGEVRRLIADLTSNASGEASAMVDVAFTGSSGAVTLPAAQTAMFRAVSIPEVPWTFDRESTVNWRFREVFADELGSYVEMAPWGV